MRRDAGLSWEKACGRGWKSSPGTYAKNSNSLSAECDFHGCHYGLFWVCECKETSKPALPYSVLSKNQKLTLKGVHNSGGLGILAIRYVGPGSARGGDLYGLTYEDFVAMGGVDRSGSIPLFPEPSGLLVPLEVVDRYDSMGKSAGKAVNFDPILEEALRAHYDRLTGVFEGLEETRPASARPPKKKYLNQPPSHRGVKRRVK